jgi:hypothetical protein
MQRRLPLVLLALGALALVATAAGITFLLRGHPREDEAAFPAAHVDALFADVAILQADLPFGECRVTRDAGLLLNPLIGLDDGVHAAARPPWWAAASEGDLLRKGGSKWTDHMNDGPRGDLSITTALLAFDGWDSTSSGAGAAALASVGEPGVTPLTIGIPQVVGFQTLARLRLLEGLRTGDMLRALQEVRHLAVLVACEESIVGQMVAVAILRIEGDGYAAAVARGAIAREAWTPLPEGTVERLKRVTFGLVGIYAGHAPPGSVERLEAVPGPIFGRCGALSEAMGQWGLYRGFVGDPWPFEGDHTGVTEAIDRVLETTPCRLRAARAFWADPEWATSMLTEDGEEAPWARLPYFREYTLHTLMGTASVNYDQYGREGEAWTGL